MQKKAITLIFLSFFFLVAWFPVSNYWQLVDGDLYGRGRTVTITSLPSVDEDAMGSNSDSLLPTQQSVKAYVDAKVPDSVKVTTKSTATTYTIGTTDADEAYGGVIYVTGACTVTAPAVTAGMSFTLITVGNYAVSLDVNASDRMILDGTALDDGDKATNPTTSGASITCVYESSSGWYCGSGSNNGTLWTDGGA